MLSFDIWMLVPHVNGWTSSHDLLFGGSVGMDYKLVIVIQTTSVIKIGENQLLSLIYFWWHDHYLKVKITNRGCSIDQGGRDDAPVEAAKEAHYLQRLLRDLTFMQGSVDVHCDSQSAIHLAENLAFNYQTKHIEVREFFLVAMDEDKFVYLRKRKVHKRKCDIYVDKGIDSCKV